MELILRYVHGFGRSDLDWMEQGPMPQPQPCCSCIARTPCLPTLESCGGPLPPVLPSTGQIYMPATLDLEMAG